MPDKASSFLQESYDIACQINNSDIQVDTLSRIAGILIGENCLEEAEKKINQALELAHTISNPSRYALLLIERGKLLIWQKKYDEGYRALQQALEKSRKSLESSFLAGNLQLLGEVEIFLRKIDEARCHLQESLDIYTRLGTSKNIREVQELIRNAHLAEPTDIYRRAGNELEARNIDSAIELLREGLSMVEEINDKEIEARFLLSLGHLLIEQKMLKEGFQKSYTAIKIIESENVVNELKEGVTEVVHQQQHVLKYLFDSAQSDCSEGLLDEAYGKAQLVLELLEIVEDEPSKILPLSMLGQIKNHQGNYQDGVQNLQESIALAQQYDLESVDGLKQVVAMMNSQQGAKLYHDAYAAAQEGSIEEAWLSAQEAYTFQCAVDDQPSQAATLYLMAQLLVAQNRKEEALEKLHKALNVAQELEDTEGLQHIQHLLDTLHQNS